MDGKGRGPDKKAQMSADEVLSALERTLCFLLLLACYFLWRAFVLDLEKLFNAL